MAGLYALFGFAAWEDWKRREVRNFISIMTWSIAIFLFELRMFLMVFLIAWAVAEMFAYRNTPVCGFADVLWFPVFYMILEVVGLPAFWVSMGTLLASQLIALTKTIIPVPLVSLMFAVINLSLVAKGAAIFF
ncbi:MAG: hypothetical protein N3E47_05015 [Candidatus Bathyarchaeota archaeon]|nr:hypothetical protein [Candidatus Bathyarchaeota archaeon]